MQWCSSARRRSSQMRRVHRPWLWMISGLCWRARTVRSLLNRWTRITCWIPHVKQCDIEPCFDSSNGYSDGYGLKVRITVYTSRCNDVRHLPNNACTRILVDRACAQSEITICWRCRIEKPIKYLCILKRYNARMAIHDNNCRVLRRCT